MASNFKTFEDVGKQLADLHLTFDTCKRHPLGKPKHMLNKIESIRFNPKKKTTLQINKIDIFDDIPKIEYRVGGRTPLEWIMDRYKKRRDKESGLETNPCKYVDIIPIIERAIYVGVESDRLISQLPKEFEPKNWTPKKIGLDAHMNTFGQSKIG